MRRFCYKNHPEITWVFLLIEVLHTLTIAEKEMHQISLGEKKIHAYQTAEPLRNCIIKWQYAKTTLKVQEVKPEA